MQLEEETPWTNTTPRLTIAYEGATRRVIRSASIVVSDVSKAARRHPKSPSDFGLSRASSRRAGPGPDQPISVSSSTGRSLRRLSSSSDPPGDTAGCHQCTAPARIRLSDFGAATQLLLAAFSVWTRLRRVIMRQPGRRASVFLARRFGFGGRRGRSLSLVITETETSSHVLCGVCPLHS